MTLRSALSTAQDAKINGDAPSGENILQFAIPKPDGTQPPPSNWLSKLPVNHRFFARPKNTPDYALLDCTVAHIYGTTGAVMLALTVPKGHLLRNVDTKNFSTQMEMYADLGLRQEQGEPDNDCDQTGSGDGIIHDRSSPDDQTLRTEE